MRLFLLGAAGVSFFVVSACTTEERIITEPPPAARADGGTTEQSTSPTEPAIGEDCQKYLDCVGEAQPEAAAAAVAAYGSTSPCWKGTKKEAATCEKSCAASLTSCRNAECALKDSTACVTCCQKVDPTGFETFDATYLSTLDATACSFSGSCGTDCCNEPSLRCRGCARGYAADEYNKCAGDATCARTLRCLESCGEDSYLGLGL